MTVEKTTEQVTYQTLIDTLWDQTKTETEAWALFSDQYADLRVELARKLDDYITKANLTNINVVNAVDGDVTVSLLARSRDANDPYPFRLSMANSAKICYKVFHMSLHEFLTGEKPTICLPSNLRAVAHALSDPTKSERYIPLYGQLKVKTEKIDPWEDVLFTVYNRVNELSSDRLANFAEIMNFGTNRQSIRPYLRTVLTPPSDGTPPSKRSSLKVGLYLAIRAKAPVDYFTVPNYIPYANIVYQETLGDDSVMVPVTDNLILYALSALLSMKQEDREEEIAKILALD